jgi:hypothetical protein
MHKASLRIIAKWFLCRKHPVAIESNTKKEPSKGKDYSAAS